jgi:hypothetical protein
VARVRIWLVVLPLLIVGSEAAHIILARLAPAGYQGAELFERSGGGRNLLPLLLSLAGALVVGGLVVHATGQPSCRVSRRVVAGLPLLAFTIQEHLEYALGHGRLSLTLVAHPAFAIGLALQLPFALAAYLAARLLLVLATAIAGRRPESRGPHVRPRPYPPAPNGVESPRLGRLPGDARLNRGPPHLAFP